MSKCPYQFWPGFWVSIQVQTQQVYMDLNPPQNQIQWVIRTLLQGPSQRVLGVGQGSVYGLGFLGFRVLGFEVLGLSLLLCSSLQSFRFFHNNGTFLGTPMMEGILKDDFSSFYIESCLKLLATLGSKYIISKIHVLHLLEVHHFKNTRAFLTISNKLCALIYK